VTNVCQFVVRAWPQKKRMSKMMRACPREMRRDRDIEGGRLKALAGWG